MGSDLYIHPPEDFKKSSKRHQKSIKVLKYFSKSTDVFLGRETVNKDAKLICTATSKRLAKKITSNMNAMETRKQRAHEVFCE